MSHERLRRSLYNVAYEISINLGGGKIVERIIVYSKEVEKKNI